MAIIGEKVKAAILDQMGAQQYIPGMEPGRTLSAAVEG